MLVGRLSPRLIPFLGKPGQCGYFCTTPQGGRFAPTYLACTRPDYRTVFEPGTLQPRGRDLTITPPRPQLFARMESIQMTSQSHDKHKCLSHLALTSRDFTAVTSHPFPPIKCSVNSKIKSEMYMYFACIKVIMN
ncbi:hypothetical protein AVEN_192517-1 [Araneus ventricosus]|uniref:Uncharacterized protein n=1 Tax=Araneus ventricosus TaxID=182803 RepID=A0A4Y2MTV0_ARAVE|nr:hypothetical protein AVEN_192517-1 [Araneus ventricosus]